MANENLKKSIGKIELAMLYSVVDINHNGTGFLISREKEKGRQFFLVTNKHMIGEWSLLDPFTLSDSIKFYLYSKDEKNPIVEVSLSLKSNGGPISNLKIHPEHTIDVVIIDITKEINDTKGKNNLNLWSIDVSYLTSLDKIEEVAVTGIGDQVFALGYPAGIKLSKTNQPIAKAGYISSSLDCNLVVNFPCTDKTGKTTLVSPVGKFFLVDGLIIGGNSGGPIIHPKARKYRVEDGVFQYTTGEIPNLVLGIVSCGLPGTGISIIFASDHILELINQF